MREYKPRPIDTSGVQLGDELADVIERLAENNHELWARKRLKDGWTFGPRRDDSRKTHPGLVPYSDLPESEKAYDREMAIEALRVLTALGFQLLPPSFAAQDQDADALLNMLQLRQLLTSSRRLTETELVGIWAARDSESWSRESELYALLGERFIQAGDPLLAYEVLEEGSRVATKNFRLDHLRGLALVRSGAVARGMAVAEQLRRQNPADARLMEDVLGLLGRAHKDAALVSRGADRTTHLKHALAAYREAFQRTGGSYPAVNAATVALLLDHKQEAAALAQHARQASLRELDLYAHDERPVYWQLATLGEAALILDEESEAVRWYEEAVRNAGERYGDIASMARQARLIASHRGGTETADLFRMPRVVVFAGHMVDAPGRLTPRFPPEAEDRAAETILQRLQQLDAKFGFSAAACGSDLLFLEAMARLNGRRVVVLPYAQEQFVESCVDVVPSGEWKARFYRALETAEVIVASDARAPASGVLLDYGSLLLLGLGIMQSRALDAELRPLAIWDGVDSADSTAAAIRKWQRAGYEVEVIAPPTSTDLAHPLSAPIQPTDGEFGVDHAKSVIGGILFADVVGFSRLNGDEEVLRFVREFLGRVGALTNAVRYPPLVGNTWGDGLYFIFSRARDAGLYALALTDLVTGMDWAACELPAMSMRVALHAGPLYSFTDPVTGHPTWAGKHVTRAARMEPVTPPGLVYASREFVAIAAAEGVEEFRCEPVGRVSLAKQAGLVPLFLVRRSEDQ